MKAAVVLGVFLLPAIAIAQAPDRRLEEPMMLRPAEVQRVSGFVAVTARTGQEWLDQCEKPGQKSDSTVRFAACMSFMKGAQLVAAPSDPTTICAQKVAAQPAGAMLDTTFAAARQYPNRPLKTVFGIAFTSLEPSECKSGR